jgi:hypothetical protein
MAGPALREPPLSSTTRMIANSSTTDSEMATTDHTLGRPLSRPGGVPRQPPPGPSCHQPGRPMRPVTQRPSAPARFAGTAPGTRTAVRTSPAVWATAIHRHVRTGIRPDRFRLHTTRSQAIRIASAGAPTAGPWTAKEARKRTFRQSRLLVLCPT